MGISFSATTTTTATTRRNTAPLYPTPTLQTHPLDYYPPYPAHALPYPAHSPPPPLPAYHPFYNSNAYTVCDHTNSIIGQPYFCPYEWPPLPPPQMVVPPCGDQKTARVVNSEVNVHKDSLRLEVDDLKPNCYLVSFDFDALADGSITICYFAKEESNRRVVSIFPEAYVPIIAPFRKGLHQEFRQPSGTGIDFSLFRLDDLSNSSSRDDVFPIVISAETRPPSYIVDHRSYVLAHELPQMQMSQVTLSKNHDGQFIPKVVRQLLWTDDICYELREIYGLGKSGPGSSDNGSGKECVICMTETKDIAALPCRHMCMCSNCAHELRLQSNKCPICREIIEELLEIKIENVC